MGCCHSKSSNSDDGVGLSEEVRDFLRSLRPTPHSAREFAFVNSGWIREDGQLDIKRMMMDGFIVTEGIDDDDEHDDEKEKEKKKKSMRLNEKVLLRKQKEWGPMQAFRYQLQVTFGGSDSGGPSSQYLTLLFPGQPLNPTDFMYADQNGVVSVKKPVTVGEAESRLADFMYQPTYTALAATGDTVSSLFSRIVSELVPAQPFPPEDIRKLQQVNREFLLEEIGASSSSSSIDASPRMVASPHSPQPQWALQPINENHAFLTIKAAASPSPSPSPSPLNKGTDSKQQINQEQQTNPLSIANPNSLRSDRAMISKGEYEFKYDSTPLAQSSPIDPADTLSPTIVKETSLHASPSASPALPPTMASTSSDDDQVAVMIHSFPSSPNTAISSSDIFLQQLPSTASNVKGPVANPITNLRVAVAPPPPPPPAPPSPSPPPSSSSSSSSPSSSSPLPSQNKPPAVRSTPSSITVESPSSPQHTRLDAYFTSKGAYVRRRANWLSECAAKLKEFDQQLDHPDFVAWLNECQAPAEADIRQAYHNAIVYGDMHKVEDSISYLDISSPGAELQRVRFQLQQSTRSFLDQSGFYYPVRFTPSDWARSLQPTNAIQTTPSRQQLKEHIQTRTNLLKQAAKPAQASSSSSEPTSSSITGDPAAAPAAVDIEKDTELTSAKVKLQQLDERQKQSNLLKCVNTLISILHQCLKCAQLRKTLESNELVKYYDLFHTTLSQLHEEGHLKLFQFSNSASASAGSKSIRRFWKKTLSPPEMWFQRMNQNLCTKMLKRCQEERHELACRLLLLPQSSSPPTHSADPMRLLQASSPPPQPVDESRFTDVVLTSEFHLHELDTLTSLEAKESAASKIAIDDMKMQLTIAFRSTKVEMSRGSWFDPSLLKQSARFRSIFGEKFAPPKGWRLFPHSGTVIPTDMTQYDGKQMTALHNNKHKDDDDKNNNKAKPFEPKSASSYLLPSYPIALLVAKDINIMFQSSEQTFADKSSAAGSDASGGGSGPSMSDVNDRLKRWVDQQSKSTGRLLFFGTDPNSNPLKASQFQANSNNANGNGSSDVPSNSSSSVHHHDDSENGSYSVRIPGPQIIGIIMQEMPNDESIDLQ